MGYCKAVKRLSSAVTLICNLTEEHEAAFRDHWHKDLSLYWRQANNIPTSMDSTRTSKSPKSVMKSATLHTTAFEVIT